ncbi:MAG TPA: plasma-membrane proton-efflux P-type ATPase [Thermoproteota archaeon]|nr:plasma-membrane proton-efflux P-type ATPase [Thermoproteota archaeon]
MTETEGQLRNGLSSEEAQERTKRYGYNEIMEKRESSISRFARQFWGISPWMLELTVLLEWITGKLLEMYIVLALLLLNAIVGFLQEERANAALDLLKQKLQINARVKRDGKWTTVPSRELVPGDVVRVRAGDFVPADVQISEGNTEVDQSALTGESLSVEKKPNEVLYSGSTVRRGEITGIVSSTGAKTYFGRTVELVQIARPKLHVEEVISRVSTWLLFMTGIMVTIGLALGVLRGIDLAEIVPLTVILLLSAIPVALPTMFTITMALGSLELAKKGVLVTRLDASEDAATMDVVCADKTGTMTMNRLSVAQVASIGEYHKEDVILYGALASQEANQDPIDLAFILSGKDGQIPLDGYLQTTFVPFDPSTRRTEAIVQKGDQRFRVLKGSTAAIESLCKNSHDELAEVDKIVEDLSGKGYRVIAVAKGTTEDEMRLVGVAGLYDTPRPDSARLVRELRDLGISVKMLTGDALPIAKEVSKQLGLGNNITRAPDLRNVAEEQKTSQIIEESDGFAEIYPEDKYSIVKGLQKRGHTVGMTGDGVNDAPPLRQAEVGIAVSNATDVAKKASSAVLTTEGLEGIVDLVKIGRTIFQRIATWIVNKMIRTLKRVVFVVLAFIFTGQYVVSTFDMILLLFLSDYVTLSISTDNVKYSKEPESWDITGLVKGGLSLGVLMVIESFLILYIGSAYFGLFGNIDQLHTFIFVWLTFAGYFTILSVRERGHFWESKPSRALALSLSVNMVVVSLISILGIPGVSPITLSEFSTVVVYSLVACLLVNDYVKFFLMKRFGIAV